MEYGLLIFIAFCIFMIIRTTQIKRKQKVLPNYTSIQYQRDLQILNDCMQIIKTTTNFETFFERSKLAWMKFLILKQAEQVKIKGIVKLKISENEFSKGIEAMKIRLIQDAYNKELESANKLKTEKGKQARMEKFLNSLNQYHYEFESVEGYEETLNRLKALQHDEI